MASNLYYNNQNQLVPEGDPSVAYYKPDVQNLQYADQGRTIALPTDILRKYQPQIQAGTLDPLTAIKNIRADYEASLGGTDFSRDEATKQALYQLGQASYGPKWDNGTGPDNITYQALVNSLKGIKFDDTPLSAKYVDPNRPVQSTQQPQQQVQQQQIQQNTQAQQNPTQTQQPSLPQGNLTTGSIVDYLNSIGQNSSQANRKLLAQQYGIQNYDFSATKNTELLNAIRSSRQSSTQQTQQFQQPSSGLGSAAETNRLLGYNAFDATTGSAAGTPPPTNNPANTGTPATPNTSTGQTATQNIIQTWADVSKQLGLSSIQDQYKKTVDESKALQDKKDTEALEINNNPWYSEGKRQMELKKLDTKYETKLNTLSNYAKLYDAQYQEAVATAKFLTTGIQDDQQFALTLAQKKQEAIDALGKDNQITEAGGRKLLVNTKTGVTVADLGASTSGVGGLTSGQISTTVNQIASSFDNEPIVKQFNVINEGYQFAKSLSNTTTNPADDQALVYAFAKAMDPNSVVREGEYATVQKYAQSMATAYGKSVQQAIAGTGFLSTDARTNIKKTIEARYNASKVNYDNVYNQYQSRISNAKAGQGNTLTDYSQAYSNIPITQPISQIITPTDSSIFDSVVGGTTSPSASFMSNVWKGLGF